MFIFKEYNLNTLLDKKDFQNKGIKYLEKYPCCDKKNCTHPSLQSDNELWKDKDFYPIAEKIASLIFNHYQKKFDLKMRMWVYFQEKDSILDRYEWHNHYRNEGKEEFSFLIYLSNTDLGTLFKVNNDITILKAKKNILYAWNSKYEHTPEPGKHPEDRVVLAGDCLLQ